MLFFCRICRQVHSPMRHVISSTTISSSIPLNKWRSSWAGAVCMKDNNKWDNELALLCCLRRAIIPYLVIIWKFVTLYGIIVTTWNSEIHGLVRWGLQNSCRDTNHIVMMYTEIIGISRIEVRHDHYSFINSRKFTNRPFRYKYSD